MGENEDSDDGRLEIETLEFDSGKSDSVLYIQDTEPIVKLYGYETQSDDEAHLNCSECGNRIKAVTTERKSEIKLGPETWTDIEGFVCGCSETPGMWTANRRDSE